MLFFFRKLDRWIAKKFQISIFHFHKVVVFFFGKIILVCLIKSFLKIRRNRCWTRRKSRPEKEIFSYFFPLRFFHEVIL